MSMLCRCQWIALLLLALPVALSSQAFADQGRINVVVNSQLDIAGIDKKQVMAMFLGRTRTFPNGTVARVFDQRVGSPARKLFFETLTGKSISDIDAYWARLRYSGRASPPKEMPSSDALISEIQQNDNALGYLVGMPAEQIEAQGLKVIFSLDP